MASDLEPSAATASASTPAGRIATGPPIPPTGLRLASALAEDDTLLLRYLTPSR
ncbi:hypothetical protein GCM10023177_71410 [Streptomyces violaceoruber]